MQHAFDSELPLGVKELLTYARNLLEFCSYKALHKLSKSSDYLADKDFRRLTYDMMLAWETPSVHTDVTFSSFNSCIRWIMLMLMLIFMFCAQLQETPPPSSKDEHGGDDDEASLFYSSSTNMAVQVTLLLIE